MRLCFDSDPISVIDWIYDELGRLVEEKRTDIEYLFDPLDYTARYQYDLASNRIGKTVDRSNNGAVEEAISYLYDANDRLLLEVADKPGTADDTNTVFEYGPGNAHTQQTGKTVRSGLTVGSGTIQETHDYEYNLQGRLSTATVTKGGTTTVSNYKYNDRGVRVEQAVAVDGGSEVITKYLIDPQNHTGYAKPIEEWVDGDLERSYVHGHAILSQALAGGDAHYFFHNGHGSTRVLTTLDGSILQRFAYEAFGKTLEGTGLTAADAALTTWLFAGDGSYTPATGLTYHLARWRDGHRFLTLDPFAGNTQDPLSLHKYLYAHADPVNNIDPTGNAILSAAIRSFFRVVGVDVGVRILIGIRATYVLGEAYKQEVNFRPDTIAINRQIGRIGDGDLPAGEWEDAFLNKPDIVDHTPGFWTVYEVKSALLAPLGAKQVDRYIGILNQRYPGRNYRPGEWQPGRNPYLITSLPGVIGLPPITIQATNVGHGVIAYTTDLSPEIIAIFVEASVQIAGLVTTSTTVQTARTQLQPAFATTLAVIGGFVI